MATEIVKNLVLGGINSIEILDGSTIKEEDFAAQFFLPNDDNIIGQPKLQHAISSIKELNPRVKLLVNTSLLQELHPSYYKNFDLVVATELTKADILEVNKITRGLGIPLYVAGLHGMFGYVFTDLIKHESKVESERGNQLREANTKINPVKTITDVQLREKDNKEVLTIVDEFSPLEDIFSSAKLTQQLNRRQLKRLSGALPLIFSLFEFKKQEDPEATIDILELTAVLLKVCEGFGLPHTVVNEEYLKLFSQQAYTEFAPVAAILGGIIAQDVIQYLGRKESPINNCLIFDAVQSEIPIYYL